MRSEGRLPKSVYDTPYKRSVRMSRIRQAVPEDGKALTRLARGNIRGGFRHSFTPADLAAHLERHLSTSNVDGWIAFPTPSCWPRRRTGWWVSVQFGPAGPAMELRRLYVLAGLPGDAASAVVCCEPLAHPDMAGADRIVL